MDTVQTLDLYFRGPTEWNKWAADIIARKTDTDVWRLEAKVDFSNQTIPVISFNDCIFPSDVDFSGAHLLGTLWFERSEFNGALILEGTTFDEEVEITKSKFNHRVIINNSTFKDRTIVTDCHFRDDVDFHDTLVEKEIWLKDVTFDASAIFIDSQFNNVVSFRQSIFNGDISFQNVQFGKLALFDRAEFRKDANFRELTFSASFVDCTFMGEAMFQHVEFRESYFHRAKFIGPAQFERAIFNDGAHFPMAEFKNLALFEDVEYRRLANYRGIRVHRAFSINNATFAAVPDFEQAFFPEAPHMDNITIIHRQRHPGVIRAIVVSMIYGNRDESLKTNWKSLAEQNRNVEVRWRTMRRLAMQNNDRDRELEFFLEERLSRRWTKDRPWHVLFWLSVFYQTFSGFGRSVARPIALWIGNWFGFSLLYFNMRNEVSEFEMEVLMQPCQHMRGRDAWIAAIGLSLSRSLPILSGLGDRTPEFYASLYGLRDRCIEIIPDDVLFLGPLQTLISGVAIFLLLLALRNIFRIK